MGWFRENRNSIRLKIIFCIPGYSFSGKFLSCWTNLIQKLSEENIDWELVRGYQPNIYRVRNELVEIALTKDFDKIMWIDSDIIFSPNDFFKLLNHNVDIISGLYIAQMEDDHRMNMSQMRTKSRGDYYYAAISESGTFLKVSDIKSLNVFTVRSNGMGFMLINKKVFTNMKNMWFNPMDNKQIISEDISFQTRAKGLGYKSYIDPSILVGHEKGIILI